MERFTYEGLNRLKESLDATGVISDSYQRSVMGWALHAVGEAYREAYKAGQADTDAREVPAQHRESVA